MEIFIDLAKITGSQVEQPFPGINLNLSGLLDFVQPTEISAVSQNPLKTEAELFQPTFNPIEYFDQIQAEFLKIKEAQSSNSIQGDLATFQEAQKNSTVALDPLAAYLENRFEKIEQITSDKSEIFETIKGLSDSRFTEIQSILNNPLTQTEEIERINSMEALTTILEKINSVDAVSSTIGGLTERLVNEKTLIQGLPQLLPENRNLNNIIEITQGLPINLNMESPVGSTVSQLLTGNTSSLAAKMAAGLSITKEIPKPDLSVETLSTLKSMADNTQALGSVQSFLNNATSQFNTTNFNQSTSMLPPGEAAPQANSGNMTVIPGGGGDTSSIYLSQMLNLLKSGQLKVKLS